MIDLRSVAVSRDKRVNLYITSGTLASLSSAAELSLLSPLVLPPSKLFLRTSQR